jgi:cell division protein FtsI (penicillin-binding protein 3)
MPDETEKKQEQITIGEDAIFLDGHVQPVTLDISEDLLIEEEGPKPSDSYDKLLENYRQEILEKIRQKEVNYVRIIKNPEQTIQEEVNALSLRGVFITPEEIFADPTMIDNPAEAAKQLAVIINGSASELQTALTRRDIRYMPIKRKVRPEISTRIKEMQLPGVGLIPEHWRYYPENSMGAQLIGFVDQDNEGQYGLEVAYNDANLKYSLKGKDGRLLIDRDPNGNQIAVGKQVLTPPQDGDSFVLTINRAVQTEVERILKETVDQYEATSGQIVVQDPQTGYVIAMATYPSYDPNRYWEAYDKIEKGIDAGEYVNKIGPEAFLNKVVSDVYEPGSVFKVITIASAMDANEVTPDSINCERQDIVVIDNYRISNNDGKAFGCLTMTQILEKSSNLGSLAVAQKLGKTLFYTYMKSYGFGENTEVSIGLENPGWVKKPNGWADVDLASASFGQGFAVNPLQMTNAVSASVNGGYLMRPVIIKKIIDGTSGEIIEYKPEVKRKVISAETSEKIKAMMVSSVDRGVAKPAKIEGYHQGGKTGTSQIAKEDGTGYEKGVGSTYATYAGFLPYDEPRFVVLVKIDRPTKGEYGSAISAPAAKKVFEFLIDYYGIKRDY